MKFGKLKETVARAMLVDVQKVNVTMRNLREGEVFEVGARGVNARDMSYLEAAALLIAHTLNPNPGRAAPSLVKTFGPLLWSNPDFPWKDEPFTLGNLVPESPTDTLEQTVAALIQVFTECQDLEAFKEAGRRMRDGSFQLPRCAIEIFPEDLAATVRMGAAEYSFQAEPKSVAEHTRQDDENLRLGRQAICFVNQEVINVIASGFRGEV